jgi:hypothetical protein
LFLLDWASLNHLKRESEATGFELIGLDPVRFVGLGEVSAKQPGLIFAPLIENVPNPRKNYQSQLCRVELSGLVKWSQYFTAYPRETVGRCQSAVAVEGR